jgi:hypothetical protein
VPSSDPVRSPPLTVALRALLDRAGDHPVTLGELLAGLGDRGTAALVVLLAAPFVQPVPLPGLSVPFGVAIGALAFQLGRGRAPWLPRFVLARSLRAATVTRVLRALERVARPLERLVRPRLEFLVLPPGQWLLALGLVLGALLLIPPFPMPGMAALPSLAIVLLALGVLERDGAAALAGYVVLAAGYFYLYLWWDVALRALRQLQGF